MYQENGECVIDVCKSSASVGLQVSNMHGIEDLARQQMSITHCQKTDDKLGHFVAVKHILCANRVIWCGCSTPKLAKRNRLVRF